MIHMRLSSPATTLRSIGRWILGTGASPVHFPADTGAADEFTQADLLHLQFLQEVIARLSTYGSFVKGWSITFAGAVFVVAAETENAAIALIPIVTTLLFWTLDGYFLWSERCFRKLFDDVRLRKRREAFYMGATSPRYLDSVRGSLETPARFDLRWRHAVRRPTLTIFYGGTIAAAALTAVLIGLPGTAATGDGSPIASQPANSAIAASPGPTSSPHESRGSSETMPIALPSYLVPSSSPSLGTGAPKP